MYGIASHIITYYCLSSSWTSWLSCTVPRVEGNSWENEPISEGLKRRKNETRTDVNAENEVLRSGMTRHVPHINKQKKNNSIFRFLYAKERQGRKGTVGEVQKHTTCYVSWRTLFQVDVEDFVAAIWPSRSCWSGKDGRSKGGIPKRLRSDPLSLSFPSVYNMFSFA